MGEIKVSFIIPNYNNGVYLYECLESISNQLYRPIEIIVVDDASTDDSVKILKECKNLYDEKDGVELIICELSRNKGVSSARKSGLKLATGEVVSTIDPDDYLIDRKITVIAVERIINYQKKGVDIAVGSITTMVNAVGEFVRLRGVDRIKDFPSPFDLLSRRQEVPAHFFCTKSILSSYLLQQEGCLYEDLRMKMKIADHCGFIFIKRQGLAYRQHLNGLSSTGRMRQIKALLNIYKDNCRKFKLLDVRHFRFYAFLLYILLNYKK